MALPEHEDLDHINLEYGEPDQFTCPDCFKTISASRPPVFNTENCSCVETAMISNGGGQLPPSPTYAYAMHGIDSTPQVNNYYRPESYASSSRSVSCPEGPENAQPNITLLNNNYLPLAPETGLNEVEHRRSSSFNSDMSYQMRRFLVEQEQHQAAYAATTAAAPNHFLQQDIHVQSQTSLKVAKSSKKSKESTRSMQSSGSGDLSYIGWPTDPIMAIGAWAEGSGGDSNEDAYPMVMSGISEYVFDE
ncbi:hypothetical protein G7Y89_g645 [Cudoniella acicularis]|uniref:Uncharacterized protein n=1 Tax=Cudoniella acicularis TaxID=354080 RepID=A0A8H4WAZ9_9HELO|nr:hypothetical protein G7Y89_g645 [Cudoniella acicularis]